MNTWSQLVEAEPHLQALFDEIKAVDGKKPGFCATAVWKRLYERRMLQLVTTEDAARVATAKLFREAMPICKHEGLCPG
jgi:hypothetical protein